MNHIKNDITFIGNAIVDILAQTTDEILKKLQIPKGGMQLIDKETSDDLLKNIKDPRIISGGSAANSAVGFSLFGGKSAFIGQTGSDDFGDLFSNDINNSGVYFEKNIYNALGQTSKSIILVTPDAERSMNTFLGASVNFNLNSINEDLINYSKLIYIEGYLFDQSDAKKAIYYCCRLAKSKGVKIALSLSDLFCVDRHRDEFLELIFEFVDVIFANESEIKSLFHSNLQDSISKIKNYVEIGAITLGAKGSTVFNKQNEYNINSINVKKIVDTTGAGDLFASGFLFGLIKNLTVEECGILGSKAAAEIIGYYGARPQVSLKFLLGI
ncbi:adenosine kinase [Alphaproteobacteria bacterium]|nr:adenosine kinase [Alphaproteobacteria bacterium]